MKNAAEVQCVIDGLGGKENILSVDNCFTRLRVNIKDPAKLDEASINKLPNSGIVKKGTDIQIFKGLLSGLNGQCLCGKDTDDIINIFLIYRDLGMHGL